MAKMTPSCHLLHLSTCLSLLLKQKSLPSFMPLKTNNAILIQFLPPYLKNAQTFSSQITPTSSIYLCQPAHFPCNSKIQSLNHFSKSHPLTRNSSQTTVQSPIYLSCPNCRNESSSPISKAISPQSPEPKSICLYKTPLYRNTTHLAIQQTSHG